MTTARHGLPRGLLARARLAAVILGCIGVLIQLGQVGNVTKSATYHRWSVSAILLLAAMLLLVHVCGRVPWWDVLVLPPLLVLGASGLIDPVAGAALVMAALIVLSMYGSTLFWVLRTVGCAVAFPVGVAVSPVSAGRAIGWQSVTVLGILPQLVLVSVLVRGIYVALVHQQTTTTREAVLARAGRDMLGATTVGQVRDIGIAAAWELVALSTSVAVIVIRRRPDGLVVHNLAGLPAELKGTAVPESVVVDPGQLAELAPVMPHWTIETIDGDVHVAVGGARRVPADVVDAFRNLSHQVVLGEAGMRSRAELDHQANHDHLTGLPNRAKFFPALGAAVDSGEPGTVALLNIDLDDFKQVNDVYGHAAGDELLVHVAGLIADAGGAGSLAARFGGDEFALLLTGLDHPDSAERLATLLCERLVAPIRLTGATVIGGASIGVAVTTPGVTAGDLTRGADIAMYSAKAMGKNRVEAFHPHRHGAAAEHRRREMHLGTAAERGEIRLGYRPRLDPGTGACAALAVHARWQHPTSGVLRGGDLLELAGRTGDLAALSRYVLRRACAGIAGRPFSVEVSARQLRDPAFTGTVLDALAEAGLDPARLELEITGGEPLGEPGPAAVALADRGVRIALDARNTRGATLAALHAYPIARLTADAADRAQLEIVRSVSRVLGTRLLITGVPDLAAAANGMVEGADLIEGDGLAPEMDAAELIAWLPPVPALA
jgi:diguanylate cyclase (GGDEF)-like protein